MDHQWKIWTHIWKHSSYFEAMLGATHFVSTRPIEELYSQKTNLVQWINKVDNWAHSDELSGIYSKLLERDQKSLLPYFKKWNLSTKPWLKRQSMVGLLFYSRFRKKYPSPSLILKHVDRHIDDQHYYVQKGVGWTLRECWNVYPDKTYEYMLKNAKRIPSAGWTAATERLSKNNKKDLMKMRKG